MRVFHTNTLSELSALNCFHQYPEQPKERKRGRLCRVLLIVLAGRRRRVSSSPYTSRTTKAMSWWYVSWALLTLVFSYVCRVWVKKSQKYRLFCNYSTQQFLTIQNPFSHMSRKKVFGFLWMNLWVKFLLCRILAVPYVIVFIKEGAIQRPLADGTFFGSFEFGLILCVAWNM